MPEIPNIAKQLAKHLTWEIKKYNSGDGIYELWLKAVKADNPDLLDMTESSVVEYSSWQDQVRFGECLAYMAMGAGVSWFDDHERFTISVPLIENYELQLWAVENCNDCIRNAA